MSELRCAKCGCGVPRKTGVTLPDGRTYCRKHGGRLPRWARRADRPTDGGPPEVSGGTARNPHRGKDVS